MKSTALFILFMFIGQLYCLGQSKSKKVAIFWGPELRTSRQSTLSDIIGYDETGIYALKTSYRRGLALEHYSRDMKTVKSVKLELKEEGKRKNLEFITQFNGEIVLFSSFVNQELKKNTLYVQSVNKRSLELENDLRKIGEIDYAGNSAGNAGGYDFAISRGRSKILIYYNLPNKQGQNVRFGFHMLDKELNPIWEKKVTLPYRDELFEVEDYQLDDWGNVYLSGIVYKNKRKSKRKGLPNYQYRVLAYSENGTKLNEYPIAVKEKFLTDMKISVTDNGDIICGGFYSEQGNFSINGSYFLKIDGETKELVSKSFKEFGVDFITQNLTEKEERKALKKERKGADNELFSYDLNEIIIKNDGGAVLIGEQYFVKEFNYAISDGAGGINYNIDYHYYYNDIIVISVSPDGQLEWTEKIPKKQRTINDRGFYSSYALSVVGDKLYFVFNDNPNNLFYRGSGKIYSFNKNKETLVVLVEVDKEGKQTREALFSTKRSKTLTRPLVCKQIAFDELVLFGQRKSIQQFARVVFLE